MPKVKETRVARVDYRAKIQTRSKIEGLQQDLKWFFRLCTSQPGKIWQVQDQHWSANPKQQDHCHCHRAENINQAQTKTFPSTWITLQTSGYYWITWSFSFSLTLRCLSSLLLNLAFLCALKDLFRETCRFSSSSTLWPQFQPQMAMACFQSTLSPMSIWSLL